MRLPKSWNDITIGQFQECYFLLKDRNIESWVKVISVLSGLKYAEVENIPIKKLKRHIFSLQFLLNPNLNTKVKKYISVNKRIYKATYNASDLSAAQAADIKTFLKPEPGVSHMDTIVENANKVLASIYLPLTWTGFKYNGSKHAKISSDFCKVKMGDVYGTLFFYSVVYEKLMQTTLDYFEKNQKEKTELMQEVLQWAKTSGVIGGGS